MSTRIVAAVVLTIVTSTAQAAGTLVEKIQENPACQQFNDGCSICEVSQGVASCSSPAIACIQTEWHCVLGPSKADQSDP